VIHPTQSPSAQSQPAHKRVTAPDIRARKGLAPIVMLTSYHAHTARILDAHCDVILVGDSLAMVMHGLETNDPGDAGHDDLAGPRSDARGRGARWLVVRPAIRLLRDVTGAGLHDGGAGPQGDRLRRHQARGGQRMRRRSGFSPNAACR